jgi:hypothetical protein
MDIRFIGITGYTIGTTLGAILLKNNLTIKNSNFSRC